MNMNIGKVLVVIGFLFVFLPTTASAGWITGLSVKNVRSQGDKSRITFTTNEPVINPANCPSTDHYGVDATNDPKSALSIVLAAFMAGKEISIYVVENSCDINGRPLVTNVLIGSF